MIDQSRITSGFDIELLMSEKYIRYFLLVSFETGAIPWYTTDTDEATGGVTHVIVHPPAALAEHRLYEPHPDFVPHPFLDTLPIVYTANPDACAVTLLPDEEEADIRVRMIFSLIAPPLLPGGDPVILTEQRMDMETRFVVLSDPLPSGFQGNVRVKLELLDIAGPFPDKARALATMKAQFDREIPLALLSDGGSILQVETRKYFAAGEDDPPTCLGLYVNFNLRSGPEPDAFFGPRGDVSTAQNFLPSGHDMAFGFGSGLYARLGSDLFQRMAAPKEGGGYYYPLDPEDPDLGKVIHAAVYPQRHGGSTPTGGHEDVYDDILVIEVEGEYFIDDMIDPNFKMKIRLIPTFDDGVLTFRTDFDLNIPMLDWLIVGSALLSFLTLKLALPLTIALLATRAIIEKIGEEEAVPRIEAKLEDASLLDAFPNRLAVEKRRWDPMYVTHHQVVSLVEQVAVNDQGMAFAAYDLRVGKEPKPRDDVVIRSEVRDAQSVMTGLLYRVADLGEFTGNADLVFPGTDRMDFVETVPASGVEATRVHLTVDQAEDRIGKGRLLEAIAYTPYKIDEVANQIYQILVLSKKEVPEIRERAKQLLRRELEQARGGEYRNRARAELLAELGREPTPEEIDARYAQILAAEVNAGAERRYRQERERYLKFDLEPSEFARLQAKSILVLEHHGLQIVKMKQRFGGTVYYRDRGDKDEGDNLLFLPRYKSDAGMRA